VLDRAVALSNGRVEPIKREVPVARVSVGVGNGDEQTRITRTGCLTRPSSRSEEVLHRGDFQTVECRNLPTWPTSLATFLSTL